MENINDFTPKRAIIVYEQKIDNSSNEYYLENRRVKKTKEGYKMMEGTPLKAETLINIASTIQNSESNFIYSKGLLPKNLLYWGRDNFNDVLIWYVKPSLRMLNFSKNLDLGELIVNLPTLIFKLNGSELSVFASKAKTPSIRSRIYSAPFHNVYDSGSICMGTAFVKKSKEISEIMKANEDAFFKSTFTHLHSQGSPIKGNLNTLLKELDKTAEDFPLKVLKKCNEFKNLNDLI